MAKKKEEVSIEAVEAEEVEAVKVEKKSEGKVWTESELAILPREEQLKVIADIKSGKASIKVD